MEECDRIQQAALKKAAFLCAERGMDEVRLWRFGE